MGKDILPIEKRKYDPLLGRNIRDIKNTDVVVIDGLVTGLNAATAVCTITADAYSQLFVYGIVFGIDTSSSTYFAITNGVGGTTTEGYYGFIGGSSAELMMKIMSDAENALCKIPAGGEFKLLVPSASAGINYTATVFAKREPILTVIETQIE